MENNKFTNTILISLENVKRAEPSEAFVLKMEAMAKAYVKVQSKISYKFVIGIAASMTLLVMFNAYTLNQYIQLTPNETLVQEVSEYNLVPTKSLYNE